MTVTLGRSDIAVDRFSLGTAALGGLYTSVSERDASQLIDAAFEAGISLFDTAPLYGHGTAERRLGAALASRPRESFVLSTKVGRLVVAADGADTGIFEDAPPSEARYAYDRSSVLRSIEESLDRLSLDRIDIVLIHDPDDHADQAIAEAYPALAELRSEGVIRAIGVGMNQSAVPTRFVEETDIDVVLLAGRYTLVDQTGVHDLLPAARRAGTSVIVGGVFNSGILANPDHDPHFDYAPASPAVIGRVQALRDVCRNHGVELARAALAFPLREAAVATVLLGARNRVELRESLTLASKPVPDDLWAELTHRGLINELAG